MRKTFFLFLWLLAFPALSLAIDCDGDSNDDHDVACGGTNASTLTDGGVLLGSGTDAVTAMSVLADGEMIVGDGTTDPVAESGATLRTSIGVGTGDSPQFTGIELSHATDNTLTASSGVLSIEGGALAPVASPTFTGTVTLPSNQALLGSPTVATSIDPDAADGAAIGSVTKEWSDAYFADGAIIYFGADQDVSITHSHNVGLLMELDDRLMFNAVTEGISSDDAGYLDLDAATGIRFNAAVSSTGDVTVGSGGDPADAGAIRLKNADSIQFEASPTGTDVNALSVDSSEVIQIGASGASAVTITPATDIVGALTAASVASDANITMSQGGSVVLTDNNTISLDATADGMDDDEYNGVTITGRNCGETLTQWDLVELVDDADPWHKADATAASGEYPAFGISVAACTDTNPAIILVRGIVRNEGWTGLTVAAPVYLGETDGAITQTAPSTSNDCVQIVGWALSDSEIYFDFSRPYQLVE